MSNYTVLPIRLGQKTAEPVGKEFRHLYELVADAFVDSASHKDEGAITTIPLWDESEIALRAPMIGAEIAKDLPELIIVDLANSNRSVLPRYSMVKGLIDACAGLDPAQRRIVFLISSRLWDDDPPMVVLKPLMDQGICSLITDRGELVGASPQNKFDVEAYEHAAREARRNPLWLLQHKIIRTHGHFKRHRSGEHDHCVHYFFDGTYCKSELAELILEKVKSSADAEHSKLILCHSTEAHWLTDAASAASNRLGYEFKSVYLEQDGSSNIDCVIPDMPIVVLPVCDRADTFAHILRSLQKKNANCRPWVLSIISTEGEDPIDSRRIVRFDGEQYEINYLLKVQRPKYSPSDCDLCKAGIPATMYDGVRGEAPEIPTFAMWKMIFEAGLQPETDVPARQSLGLVPNFSLLVEKNGPYLATKIHKTLAGLKGKLPRDPIIVCPDERGARTLASALTHIFKYTVISIPRDVIGNPETSTTPQSARADWFIQMGSLRSRGDKTELIVLDEFNALGGTRAGLKAVADKFELGVRCYLSLFDFNPRLATNYAAQVHALYAIDWLGEAEATPA